MASPPPSPSAPPAHCIKEETEAQRGGACPRSQGPACFQASSLPTQPPDGSVAILLYLSRKYEVPDHWYPQDLQARARVDEYLAWQHTALRSSCTRAMWQKQMMFPVFLGEQVPPETLASTLAELDRCLQLLEDKFLKDQDFVAGPHISVADLVAITELMHPVSAGCQVFKSRPKLAAWRQRVEAEVGKDLFQEAHAAVMKVKDLPPADPAIKEKLKPSVQGLLQ
ncbi:glutathione S-transferase theta-3-like isoform X3 [Halichoerus grypus]|uniref:glutathione S-transferase theta-3-like isoform X4 n=1 Tax=Halichoerus grypus TaxID=9711 RepID=UPI00165A06FE|nr:glutathione S-transferase theta-3-like isoform X4 [Halichoerus grypus]